MTVLQREGAVMRSARLVILVLAAVLGTEVWGTSGASPPPATAKVEHVLLIVLENQEADDVWSNPTFHEIASHGVRFTRSSGIAHPSYPNYLALVGVHIHNTPQDWRDKQRDFADDVPSIVDRLEGKHLTWKSYVEDYPADDRSPDKGCGAAADTPTYVRRHVPLLSFGHIQHSAERCAHVVDAKVFDADIQPGGVFPNYAFYTPNLCHDGHGNQKGCGFGTVGNDEERLTAAAAWLSKRLDTFRSANPDLAAKTLIIVTFDESDNYLPTRNEVFTVFLGDMLKPQQYDGAINHYSVLRTIEDQLGIDPVGDEASLAGPNAPLRTIWMTVAAGQKPKHM